ncbi:glycoside hydrolase family 95 protein [Streptomyces sp. NBC_00237]|uniref:glycoside hydrolase family 95 protein n=1 Tax=Streptomyces sp. NBC_00237 TaxID=2975687 RepID=UPI002257423F|nr:glycoside hydrolase family 95 protein [Streptomyces sp. NBC_00237]MCX5202950.1 glycoside hydrolase family 95 protein [Streptomyces sp. NBC_00237]
MTLSRRQALALSTVLATGAVLPAASPAGAATAPTALAPTGRAPGAAAAPSGPVPPAEGHTLWYDKPATHWEREALPLGSGDLGVKVFGGVATEQLQLNEKSLWTGGPGSKEGYDHGDWPAPRPGALDEVRRIIDEKGSMDPDEVSRRLGNPTYGTPAGIVPGFGNYQNFGSLVLDLPGAPASPVAYRRHLDLNNALAGVSYRDATTGTTYTREYFASHPGRVVAGRLTADRPGQVTFTLRIDSAQSGASTAAENGRITVAGALADNGLRYEGQVQVVAQGGTRTESGGRITVTGADSAVFVFSAGTDYADRHPTYRGTDPHDRVTSAVTRAAAQPYEGLRAAHIADHRRLYDRVRLDIGQRMPADVPTDQLLAGYRADPQSPADRALEALFFRYGRYLLIASSRPGSLLPANLQGVWNNSNTPPWNADYHTNINIQMNYWPAEITNLAETAGPYHDLVDALRPPGRKTAREMFGAPEGWVVHQNTNPFGYTGVHDWSTSFWMPEANGWLVQQMYEHYLFGRDRAYLRTRAYPAMKEAARFWLANLHTDPRDATLVVSPSYSPEQGEFTAGASISQQIVFDLLTNTVEASEVLGVDRELREKIKATLTKLDPGLRIGRWGQLQEWKADVDDPANTHRHVSHLFALHPGRQIEPGTEFAAAAEVSLAARGDGGTGWSKAWKINFWALLGDGDHAARMLGEQLKSSTLPNLWDTHPPFQIDGNFGATAGIAEMLLQGRHGTVHVLPALPSAWAAKGSYDGLRARGGFTVGVDWQEGRPVEIRITSTAGGTAKVRHPALAGRVRVVRAGGGSTTYTAKDGVLGVPTRAGETYRIRP